MLQGTLTAELRQHVRHAIDQHARARRQALIDAGELQVCANCGGELDQQTIGCKGCWDRKRRRARRSA